MKNTLRISSILATGLLLTASLAHAQSASGPTTVQVTLLAEASITVTTGTTTLGNGSTTVFNNFTGTTNFTYKIRTTKVGGSGTITVLFGGPLTDAASDTIALTNLTYTCSDTAPASGTACASALTASSSTATKVADFVADAHSADSGTTGNSVSWTLVNNPSYKTGVYSATATFTISAS